MGFLDAVKSLFNGGAGPLPFERVPALAPLVNALATDPRPMWAPFFNSLQGQWDLRVDAGQAIAQKYFMKLPAGKRAVFLDQLVAADPASWLIVRAHWLIDEAWEARGSGQKVKNRALFHQLLQSARQAAEVVVRGEPRDPSAFVVLLRIAKGLGDDTLRASAYQHATQRAPDCFACHLAFNDGLSERWGGSHEEQLAHARHVAQSAPHGSLVAGLPINAHFFHLSHEICFNENQGAAVQYVSNPQVIADIQNAASRSVDAPNHIVSAKTFTLQTQAAILGWKANNADMARHYLARVGDVFLADSWNQIADHGRECFDGLRKLYGLR